MSYLEQVGHGVPCSLVRPAHIQIALVFIQIALVFAGIGIPVAKTLLEIRTQDCLDFGASQNANQLLERPVSECSCGLPRCDGVSFLSGFRAFFLLGRQAGASRKGSEKNRKCNRNIFVRESMSFCSHLLRVSFFFLSC